MKKIIALSVFVLTLCLSCVAEKLNDSETRDQSLTESEKNAESQANQAKSILSTKDSIRDFEAKQKSNNPYSNSKIDYTIINAENNTYGYTISIDNNLTINQTSIPGQPGNNGFSTKGKAQKTAEFVVHKIRNNIMPPTISENELDSLGVLH